MSDGHLAEVQVELGIEKRTRDEVMALTSVTDLQKILIWPLDFTEKMIASYEVPKMMNYVRQNDKRHPAEIGIKEWTRKFQIAQQENLVCSISYDQEQILKAKITLHFAWMFIYIFHLQFWVNSCIGCKVLW